MPVTNGDITMAMLQQRGRERVEQYWDKDALLK